MEPSNSTRRSAPWWLLRIEGLALCGIAVWAFALSDESWWLFVALILVPDLALLGYLLSPAVGAAAYNFTHTLVGSAVLIAGSLVFEASLVFALAMIWAAHIGIDRLVGYGLKYPAAAQITHLQRV